MLLTEHLMFVVHLGSVGCGVRKAGIVGMNSSLPIACSHASHESRSKNVIEYGFYALWESVMDVEEFFEHLLFSSIVGGEDNPNGLYVYSVTYDSEEVCNDVVEWEYLQGGDLRRPTIEELECFARSEAPWGGVVF